MVVAAAKRIEEEGDSAKSTAAEIARQAEDARLVAELATKVRGRRVGAL